MSRHGRLLGLRVALAVLALAAGVVAVLARPSSAPVTVDRRPASVPAVVVAPAGTSGPAPISVAVPAVGIDSTLVPLTLDATGTLSPPQATAIAGWFAGGPTPGAVGPAVLAGHVDSRHGPGGFFRLARATPGDEVLVARADGSTARFTVTRVAQYPKGAFPTADVYGPTGDAQLRLITCGGAFDRTARSYEDDVVVYAKAR